MGLAWWDIVVTVTTPARILAYCHNFLHTYIASFVKIVAECCLEDSLLPPQWLPSPLSARQALSWEFLEVRWNRVTNDQITSRQPRKHSDSIGYCLEARQIEGAIICECNGHGGHEYHLINEWLTRWDCGMKENFTKSILINFMLSVWDVIQNFQTTNQIMM